MQRWIRGGVLLDWSNRIKSSCAGRQDLATVQRAIAHRDARITLLERASMANVHVPVRDGLIQPRMDRTAPAGGFGCSVAGKRVRFTV